MSTKVTRVCGYLVRISPASSTPTAPAPTMITLAASASLAAASRHDAARCTSDTSLATGLIGRWYVEPVASTR